MTLPPPYSDLEAFARKCIAADRYPQDHHIFKVFNCDACEANAFELTIEHHSGSKKGRFKGVIWGECMGCGSRKRLFSFTGEHRTPVRQEKPACKCGNTSFTVGECERFEAGAHSVGFFDEGMVVGKCLHCGRNQVLVDTD